MAKEKQDSVFEVTKIRELIELMQEHELSEVDLKQADQRIRLRRGNDQQIAYAPVPAAVAPATAAAPAAEAPAEDPNIVFIESPTIGTFYSKPKPESDNFVKPGDMVTPDTVVCIVEAMKMFNEITAGISGKIVECLVANEEPVDNNKPLFKVLKS
ncbi:MAG: acetyl-CoA carboxylase biotin carboxyl carrier protein [Mariniblastus sp.]|jgi:acetyl-CoA carboxylase biotin carboxyl carrier protein|nr:acetyl-CoA carboxylase biotin carboxyl carrier protein [Mariniblastus sp.]